MLRLTAKRALAQAGVQAAKNVAPIFGMTAYRLSKQLTANTTYRMQQRFKSDTVYLPVEKLKPGYAIMRNRLHDVMSHAAIAAMASPAVSSLWLLFTQQPLTESPVAMAALGLGGFIIVERMMQAARVKKYAKLSLKVEQSGPAKDAADNQRIRQIMAGTKPTIKFGMNGTTISGPIGDLAKPSEVVSNTLSRIRNMNRIVIPTCVLTPQAEDLTGQLQDRWLARINFPLAIFNMMTILGKKSEDRRADDYVVLAASIASIGDFFMGKSVQEARQQFTDALTSCKTPQDVLKVLIDNNTLDEGGMSFLNEWIKNQNSIALRVSRTGAPIFYQNRSFSFGGPYPMHLFAEKTQSTSPEAAVKSESSLAKRK